MHILCYSQSVGIIRCNIKCLYIFLSVENFKARQSKYFINRLVIHNVNHVLGNKLN